MKKPARPFTHIDTWVFDLDNTLYPHHVNLWQQVDARIGEFVSAWLKISAAGAEAGDGGGDRKAARPQADPDQRLDRPCRRGFATARPGHAFRGGVRHYRRRSGAETGAADLRKISQGSRGRSLEIGDVRGSLAQSCGAASARHDHGAGGARRVKGSG